MGRWGCWHHRWVIASYWDAVVCYTGWNAACIRESNRKASRTLIKNPSLSSIWYVMSPKGRDRHSGSWFFCEGETLDDTTKVYKSDIIFWSMAKDFLNLCTWRCCVLQEPHPQIIHLDQANLQNLWWRFQGWPLPTVLASYLSDFLQTRVERSTPTQGHCTSKFTHRNRESFSKHWFPYHVFPC